MWSSAPMEDINTPATNKEPVWFHGFSGQFADRYTRGTPEELEYLATIPSLQGSIIGFDELTAIAVSSQTTLTPLKMDELLHLVDGKKLERKEIPYEDSDVPLFD